MKEIILWRYLNPSERILLPFQKKCVNIVPLSIEEKYNAEPVVSAVQEIKNT